MSRRRPERQEVVSSRGSQHLRRASHRCRERQPVSSVSRSRPQSSGHPRLRRSSRVRAIPRGVMSRGRSKLNRSRNPRIWSRRLVRRQRLPAAVSRAVAGRPSPSWFGRQPRPAIAGAIASNSEWKRDGRWWLRALRSVALRSGRDSAARGLQPQPDLTPPRIRSVPRSRDRGPRSYRIRVRTPGTGVCVRAP